MGDTPVLAEGAEPGTLGLAQYQVVRYAPSFLPLGYRTLIFARWKRSLRHGNDYFRLVRPDAYYTAYERYIQQIMRDGRTAVRLAVLADDHDVVLGFSVVRENILDYVHVQADQRKQGIAKALVPVGIDTITHLTKFALPIWGSKYPGWAFNPFV